ncbi:MAG TPA: hypothetical protein VJ000_01215 [Thermodesulfovibrionia bacterium]|nr:MAG: hypothetical protein A2Z57_10900 [Planctomycetes bacterium RIFCSPHIGHO2_12_39_6]HLA49791.1 hypothetical protein [Thermodesulfovibrionia bacterium]
MNLIPDSNEQIEKEEIAIRYNDHWRLAKVEDMLSFLMSFQKVDLKSFVSKELTGNTVNMPVSVTLLSLWEQKWKERMNSMAKNNGDENKNKEAV